MPDDEDTSKDRYMRKTRSGNLKKRDHVLACEKTSDMYHYERVWHQVRQDQLDDFYKDVYKNSSEYWSRVANVRLQR